MRNFYLGNHPSFSVVVFSYGAWITCFLWRFALSFRLNPRNWFNAFGWSKDRRIFNIRLGAFGLDYFPPNPVRAEG